MSVHASEMSTWLTSAVLLVTVCCKGAHGLVVAITDPPTSDANPTVIAAAENATNVTVFCEVARDGSARQNIWFIGGSDVIIFDFDAGGKGKDGFENFMVTSGKTVMNVPLRTNLTIRVFNRALDMVNISCGSGNDIAINGTYILRVISE